MYRLLIVEDEQEQLNALGIIVNKYFPEIEIVKCHTFQNAISHIKESQHTFHFFLLDIDLQEGSEKNGLLLCEHIRRQKRYEYAPVIFVTGYPDKIQYALNKLHCADFITKPYVEDDIYQTLTTQLHSPVTPHPPIIVPDIEGVQYQIQQTDIIYVKAYKKLIHIHTTHDTITTRKYSLISLLKQLSSADFIQCHKNCIINWHYMTNYDKTTQVLHLNTPFVKDILIPIGRTYKKNIEERMHFTNGH